MSNQNKKLREAAIAQHTDFLLSKRFADVRDSAFEEVDGDGEKYADWRSRTNLHLADLALAVVGANGNDISQAMWDVQQEIALETLEGRDTGPFSKFFFHAMYNGRPIEARQSDGLTVADMPAGDINVARTNTGILRLHEEVDDPIEFLTDSLEYVYERRLAATYRETEGPENYATMLKLYTDKLRDSPIDDDELDESKALVNSTLKNFLRAGEKDAPNVVELNNVFTSILRLPKNAVESSMSGDLISYALRNIDDFSADNRGVLLSAIANMNLEECPEGAAMAVDLILRKSVKMDRSLEMLTALRAVENLPYSTNSEHAVTTLLDVRNSIEEAANIPDLLRMSKLLKSIIEKVTENPRDSVRISELASRIHKLALDRYKKEDHSKASPAKLNLLRKNLEEIGRIAQSI